MSQFKELFTDIFQKNGLDQYIRDDIMAKFEELTDIMIATNAVMNITALTTVEKIIPLHYADCAKVAAFIPLGARVADIGCGGGFPILPLAIIRPDLQLVGIDSTDKKIKYVQNTADHFGLHVRAISGRAEDLAKMAEHRDAYDIVVSRAVARLNVLDELCMPFVKIDGKFIAMKGAAGQEELNEATNGIHKLGGELISAKEYELHTGETAEKRVLIEIQKTKATPKEFPRGFGAIKKKPL
jgi:16S rRNA (guanine527-N7)-methyltransferase